MSKLVAGLCRAIQYLVLAHDRHQLSWSSEHEAHNLKTADPPYVLHTFGRVESIGSATHEAGLKVCHVPPEKRRVTTRVCEQIRLGPSQSRATTDVGDQSGLHVKKCDCDSDAEILENRCANVRHPNDNAM